MFRQELWNYYFLGLPSRVLETTVFPARMDLLLQWLDSVGLPMGGHAYSS
jgi:hypothetical protein